MFPSKDSYFAAMDGKMEDLMGKRTSKTMFYKLPAAKVSLVELQLFGKIFFQDKFNRAKT